VSCVLGTRTAKHSFALGYDVVHGKGAFAVRLLLCRAQYLFFHIFSISILFFLILIFILQLVLYFVDYLLVLLKTMCIYPCFLQYKHTLHRHPPPTYIRVSEQTRFEELMC
jgi:hypothetical protein